MPQTKGVAMDSTLFMFVFVMIALLGIGFVVYKKSE
jgi:hypothetical protein